MKIFPHIILVIAWMSSGAQVNLIEDDKRSLTEYYADQIVPGIEGKRTFMDLIDITPQQPIFFLLPNSIEFVKPNVLPITFDHAPGIFCKMEYKIEGKSKLAPRFRLGSLNYTEWMEGKRDIYSRYWK